MRERKCERQRVGKKGLRVGHKLDHWSSIYEGLETGFSIVYQDGN